MISLPGFPPSPADKRDWPWAGDSQALLPPAGQDWPRISHELIQMQKKILESFRKIKAENPIGLLENLYSDTIRDF
jgi:hypothetical protein